MRIYLAGTYSRKYVHKMKIYMAGEHEIKNGNLAEKYNKAPYILESYYYMRKNCKWMLNLIPRLKGFLLDSGAFTFMTNTKKSVDWNKYVDEYAEFINQYNIKYFFELDIDSVTGLKLVEQLRERLEKKTKKQCIPVWHKSRGKEYFINLVKEYDYVAIGGIVTKEILRNEHKYFPWFIEKAHENNCKIHGLGYTNLKGLNKYKFDSVDSTAWLYGNRGGYLYQFNGKTLIQIHKPKNTMLKSRKCAIYNFGEWVKFANYMDKEYI